MPTHLFNPCNPHDDQVVGWLDQRSGKPCGNCVNVPRAWEIIGVGKSNPGTGSGAGSGTFSITDKTGDGTTDGVSLLSDSFVTVLVAWTPTANAWWQFLSVPIPPKARIAAATLTLTLNAAPQSALDQYFKLTGSPSSSQAEPTAAGWYGLARTASQVTGFVPGTSVTNQAITFDMTAIVQEIVSGSWAANGSLMFFMDGQAPPGGGGGSGVAWKALDSNADLPLTSTSLAVSWISVDPNSYVNCFMGKHVLTRDQVAFANNGGLGCAWGCSIDLTPIGAPHTPGGINLSYTSVTGDGGGDQWFINLDGLPAIGASPPDVAWYKLNAFAFSPIDNRPLRCLTQNTFYREDLLGSGGFPAPGLPDTLLIQPFWP